MTTVENNFVICKDIKFHVSNLLCNQSKKFYDYHIDECDLERVIEECKKQPDMILLNSLNNELFHYLSKIKLEVIETSVYKTESFIGESYSQLTTLLNVTLSDNKVLQINKKDIFTNPFIKFVFHDNEIRLEAKAAEESGNFLFFTPFIGDVYENIKQMENKFFLLKNTLIRK